MKVLFVNHNISLWVNVGMTYVMSSVARRHEARLFDRMTQRRDFKAKLMAYINEFSPDVAAFSVNSYTLSDACVLARQIKKHFPKVIVVFGGVQPTIMPEETIALDCVDVICIGEGEAAFAEYLDKLERRDTPNETAGIWYKDAKGKVIKNALRAFEPDIDSFVFPDWDFWDIEAYMNQGEIVPGTLRLLTSRGCPFHCSFCSNAVWQRAVPGAYYRKRCPEKIIEEIEYNVSKYSDKGFKFLMISDSIFGLDKGQMREFLELYIQKGFSRRLPWGAQMRCGSIDEEIAASLKRAGCERINISIESGNDRMRNDVYKKGFSKAAIRSAVQSLQRNNILVRAFVMAGGPGETNAMFEETLRFSRELGLSISDLIIIRYAPLPKTELAERVKEDSVTRLSSPFSYKNVAALKSGITAFYYFRLRLLKIYSFLREGFALAGFGFIRDIGAILRGKGKKRFIPLVYLCSEQRIINETIVVYKGRILSGVQ